MRTFTVRTTADGQVDWAILAGPKARSGLIESEDERREAREIEAARRGALENVDWTRRFDVRRVPSLNYAATERDGVSAADAPHRGRSRAK